MFNTVKFADESGDTLKFCPGSLHAGFQVNDGPISVLSREQIYELRNAINNYLGA